MTVVALLTDVALRLRLTDALKGAAAPIECATHVRDARARLAAGDVRLLVVGLRDAGGYTAATFVAEVRQQWPSVTVVAYYTSAAGSSDDVLALGRAGVHALVLRGVDDERYAFRAVLRGAEQACVARLVYERVRDHLPPAVAPLVALYLRADGEPPTVAAAAEQLGVHRKTLVNRLAAAGCPTPRALRTWCRLFIAARLLEEPGRTVESIALQLDFESTTGLRNAIKRYLGAGASAVRAAGGLGYVLAQFNAACAARRPRGAAVLPLVGAAQLPHADPAAERLNPAAAGQHADLPPESAAGCGHPNPPHLGRRIASVTRAATRALTLVVACWSGFGGLDDVLPAAFDVL